MAEARRGGGGKREVDDGWRGEGRGAGEVDDGCRRGEGKREVEERRENWMEKGRWMAGGVEEGVNERCRREGRIGWTKGKWTTRREKVEREVDSRGEGEGQRGGGL